MSKENVNNNVIGDGFTLGEMKKTNIPDDDMILFFNTENGTGERLSKAGRFVVKHYMVFDATRLDKETGEVIPTHLVKCVAPNGDITYTTGIVASKGLLKLLDRFGDRLIETPLELEVYEVDLKEGKGHDIRIVGYYKE